MGPATLLFTPKPIKIKFRSAPPLKKVLVALLSAGILNILSDQV